MLKLFRTNQLLLSFQLIFYAGFLHSFVFIYPTSWQPADFGVFTDLIYQWIGPKGLIPDILTIFLLFLHGSLLNGLNLTHRFSEEVSLFPGLFYVLVASLLPEFLHLSPLHLANTFYLLALIDLLSVYNQPRATGHIFNAGLWIGMGSLFYFSYLIFILLAFLSIHILRTFDLRERLMVLLGVLTPYILTALYYFWTDRLDFFLEKQFALPLRSFDLQAAGPAIFIYLKLALFALLLSIVLLSHHRYLFKKTIQVQKKINILFWGLLVTALTLLFQPAIQIDHLLLLAPPLGMLLSINFISFSKSWAELFHVLLLLTAFSLQFLSI